MDINRFIRAFKRMIEDSTYFKSVLKGKYYKALYRIFNKSVRIGKNFRVMGRLSIRGPGRVVIGDNVILDGRVTPWTFSDEAEISIGNDVFLNGTRFACKRRIEIGNDCILADCRILDSDFHSIQPAKRNDRGYIKTEAIKICSNVWITLDCIILKGVTINRNSTITPNSVVFSDVQEYALYGGNPARLIRYLPHD